MVKYYPLNCIVRIPGITIQGSIYDARAVNSFDHIEYRVAYGSHNGPKAYTGWLADRLITPVASPMRAAFFFPYGNDRFINVHTLELLSQIPRCGRLITAENHSLDCLMGWAKILMAAYRWDQKWPTHCPACQGRGGFESYDTVPYGMGTTRMASTEPCSLCSEAGLCPRCGGNVAETLGDGVSSPKCYEDWLADPNWSCPLCGWRKGFHFEDSLPFLDEVCSCTFDTDTEAPTEPRSSWIEFIPAWLIYEKEQEQRDVQQSG